MNAEKTRKEGREEGGEKKGRKGKVWRRAKQFGSGHL